VRRTLWQGGCKGETAFDEAGSGAVRIIGTNPVRKSKERTVLMSSATGESAPAAPGRTVDGWRAEFRAPRRKAFSRRRGAGGDRPVFLVGFSPEDGPRNQDVTTATIPKVVVGDPRPSRSWPPACTAQGPGLVRSVTSSGGERRSSYGEHIAWKYCVANALAFACGRSAWILGSNEGAATQGLRGSWPLSGREAAATCIRWIRLYSPGRFTHRLRASSSLRGSDQPGYAEHVVNLVTEALNDRGGGP